MISLVINPAHGNQRATAAKSLIPRTVGATATTANNDTDDEKSESALDQSFSGSDSEYVAPVTDASFKRKSDNPSTLSTGFAQCPWCNKQLKCNVNNGWAMHVKNLHNEHYQQGRTAEQYLQMGRAQMQQDAQAKSPKRLRQTLPEESLSEANPDADALPDVDLSQIAAAIPLPALTSFEQALELFSTKLTLIRTALQDEQCTQASSIVAYAHTMNVTGQLSNDLMKIMSKYTFPEEVTLQNVEKYLTHIQELTAQFDCNKLSQLIQYLHLIIPALISRSETTELINAMSGLLKKHSDHVIHDISLKSQAHHE